MRKLRHRKTTHQGYMSSDESKVSSGPWRLTSHKVNEIGVWGQDSQMQSVLFSLQTRDRRCGPLTSGATESPSGRSSASAPLPQFWALSGFCCPWKLHSPPLPAGQVALFHLQTQTSCRSFFRELPGLLAPSGEWKRSYRAGAGHGPRTRSPIKLQSSGVGARPIPWLEGSGPHWNPARPGRPLFCVWQASGLFQLLSCLRGPEDSGSAAVVSGVWPGSTRPARPVAGMRSSRGAGEVQAGGSTSSKAPQEREAGRQEWQCQHL